MNRRHLETEFRKFSVTAEKWKALVEAHSVFHDTNANGEAFRHVALTNDPDVLQEARQYIADWQAFADLCEEAGKKGIASNIFEPGYLPVPFIIEDRSRSTYVTLQSATSAKLMTRDQLLKKYKSLVGILDKTVNTKSYPAALKPLLEEYQFFLNEHPDEQYRMRKDGFTDTVIASSTSDSITPARYRVGTHGALVFAHLPETKVPVFNYAGKRRRTTVYDCTKPIPCSLIGECELYRVSDLDHGQKTFITQIQFLRNIESRNMKFNQRVAALKAAVTPETEDLINRKIDFSRAALEKLEEMDMELIDILMASGDDLYNMKLTYARKHYGKSIEERHGETFTKVQSAAKLRV